MQDSDGQLGYRIRLSVRYTFIAIYIHLSNCLNNRYISVRACVNMTLFTQAPWSASVPVLALVLTHRGPFARNFVAGMAALRWADMYEGSGEESVGFGSWESRAPRQNDDEENKKKTKAKRSMGKEPRQWEEDGEPWVHPQAELPGNRSAAFSQELPLKIEPGGSSEQQLAGRLYQAVSESSDLELRMEAGGVSQSCVLHFLA